MHSLRPTGRGASSRKYDILTALGAFALRGSKHEQRRVLRFMLLITARYNWRRDRLSVGQREIAMMWSCDERTVKREMARLRALGWLKVIKQGARGRVTEYSIDFRTLMTSTAETWQAVGPDFQSRMELERSGGLPTSTVIPLPVKGKVAMPSVEGRTEWDIARLQLHSEDEATYAAWIHALSREGRAGGILTLKAPSRFHASYVTTHLEGRLLAACQRLDDTLDHIAIIH